MNKYDYFKFLFVILLAVGFSITISVIDEQRIDNKELLKELNKSLQVSDDLFNMVKDRQLKIDLLLNQIDLHQKTLNTQDERIIELSEMYNNYNLNADTMILRPTYQQVISFLARDHTDIKAYKPFQYTCVDFSNKLIANARNKGIFACSTYLAHLDGKVGHSIVAFNTIDRGIIYVEPQNDNVMTKDFGVGSVYWDIKVVKISSCWID